MMWFVSSCDRIHLFDPVMSVWNSELLVLDHSSRFKNFHVLGNGQHFFQSKQCLLHFATIPHNQKNNAQNRISWRSSSAFYGSMKGTKAVKRSFEDGKVQSLHRQMDAARSLGIDRCETAVICCPLLGKSLSAAEVMTAQMERMKRKRVQDSHAHPSDLGCLAVVGCLGKEHIGSFKGNVYEDVEAKLLLGHISVVKTCV